MGSKQPERSIASSSIFIPNWVKNKFDNSGFDPSALSPPTHDSEFFYVKIPKSDKMETSQYGRIEVSSQKGSSMANHGGNLRNFIPLITDSVQTVKPKMTMPIVVESDLSPGERIVIPQQVISGNCKPPVRGFTTDDASDKPTSTYLSKRRNSRSLPASPIASPEGSPRAMRKNPSSFTLQNKFNLGSVAAASLNESDENIEKKSGSSWLLSALFSHSERSGLAVKNNENSVAANAERSTGLGDKKELSGVINKTNLNVTVDVGPSDSNRKVYRQKRSEIRELNFISPLSM